MADEKITQLSEQTSASGDDLLAIVDDPDTLKTLNKITKANFTKGTGPETRTVLATNATVVASAMTNISGMSIPVSAGGIYRFESMLMINRTGAVSTTTNGYGLTFPKMTQIRGTYYITTSSIQSSLVTASVGGARMIFGGDSASGSVLVSTATVNHLSAFARIEAIMIVSTSGVIQLQAKTNVAANSLIVIAGSYMEVVRLN